MMRKFLVRLSLFLLPLLLLLGAVEQLARQIPNSYAQKYQWMEQHAPQVQTLLLGNSHGLFGIRPDALAGSAYNLCNVSQTFEYDYFLLRHFVDSCRRLTTVVLVVDNSNLFDAPLESSESFRCTYYRLYMDYPKHALFSEYGFELSHPYALREKVADWMAKRGRPCDSLGWNETYTLAAKTPANCSAEAVRNTVEHHRCKDMRDAEANRAMLCRIAQLCRQRGLRLVLLQTPVMKAYNGGIDRTQKLFLQQTLSVCRNSYEAQVLDFAADTRFGPDDFYDVDHLSDVGAAKFSRVLAEALARQ